MTSPSPSPQDAFSSANDRSSGPTSARPQQQVWGLSAQQLGRSGLAPLSTSLNTSSTASNTSSLSPRNPWSPPSVSASTTLPSSQRNQGRSASISSSPSLFSPPASVAPQPYTSQLLSAARSRNIGPSSNPQLASSAASSSQGGGTGGSSGGGGASKLSRASPSLSHSSFGSPNIPSNPAAQSLSQTGQLSKIVVAQLFLLLSTIKEDKDKPKWESQVEQIRKLVESHGMEVFAKYFGRLVYSNKAQIWSQGRSTETTGSYQILVSEIQKITRDSQQAPKVAESIDTTEGETFKDFDLSTFMDHFKLSPVGKTALALAFRKAGKADLRTKADAILSSNLPKFLSSLATLGPDPAYNEDLSPEFLSTLIDRIAQDPPRSWTPDVQHQLTLAIHRRYLGAGFVVPPEVSSAMQLFDLLSLQNSLVRLVQRTGSKGTENLDACRALLQSAELRDIGYQQVANTLLFMVIARAEPPYNPALFVSALREHRGGQRLDWQDVLTGFDRDSLTITKYQFQTLYKALLPLAHEFENFDISQLWGGEWNHSETQLSFVSSFLSHDAEELDAAQIPRLVKAFELSDFKDAPEDARAYAEKCVHHPFVSFEAAKALFNMVFRSNDTYTHAQRLGVVENVINTNTDLFVCSVSAIPKPWGALQDQAIRQLVLSFLSESFDSHKFVFHILSKRDKTWLFSRLQNFYHQDQARLYQIFDCAQEHGWLHELIAMNNDLSLDLVVFAHGRHLFDLEGWLHQTAQSLPPPTLTNVLVQFLNSKAEKDILVNRDREPPTTVPLTVRTVHTLLGYLAERVGDGLPEEDLVTLQRLCIQAYPRLINYGEGFDDLIDGNGQEGNALPPEADIRMQDHYKKMYSGESDVREIITILQGYKTSRDPQMQELFACMIFGLFDEYSCFGEYPLDALATTAVLFGSIINYKLLGRTALQCAIAMVLEAVRDKDPSTSMYKFGLQSLLQFQERLLEWPILCERLVNVPGLQGTDAYKAAQSVVAKESGNHTNGDAQPGATGSADNLDGFLAPTSRVPSFTCLSVDPPLRPDFYEDPEEKVQEAVLFIFNNVSERNMDVKLEDLKRELDERHYQWFASYLVEERVKVQANLQQLYMDLLSAFNDNHLWIEILRETYASCIKMLNAEATMNSSTERANLKNLGTWLGSMTLARNKAIKFRNMSFKDLLIEAHDTQRLIAVIPFTCKVLSQASQSLIFRPPNAWTMELVSILMELYHHVDLKLNLKFEIEVLCKTLDLDYKNIEPSEAIRRKPQPEDEVLSTTMPDGPEGFNDFSMIGLARSRAPNERFSPSVILPELSELPSILKHNYAQPPGHMVGQNRLKQLLDAATQQAVQEIISPVVERSVTIAAISTSQLIAKDFAMEPDEARYRDSAHTAVKSLAGSLALVTCKEPLRASMTNNIRLLARDPEAVIPEGLIIMFVNDNLDTVCSFVEKAAESASIGEINAQIDEALNIRKSSNFREPPISRWAYFIPEPYKPVPGGLNREQMAIYEDFGRSARGATAHTVNASQDSARQLPDLLQDPFGAVPGLQTPADAPAMPRQGQQHQLSQLHTGHAQQAVNGYGEGLSPTERAVDIIAELCRAAEEVNDNAQVINLVRQSVNHLRALFSNNLTAPQIDNTCVSAAHKIGEVLSGEPSRESVADASVQVLSRLRLWSETVNYMLESWMANWNEERLSNVFVTIGLLKYRLLDPEQVDASLTEGILAQRTGALEVFKAVVYNLLCSDPPFALRSDFAGSTKALTYWLSLDPGLPLGREIMQKLNETISISSSLDSVSSAKTAQAEYVLEEWISLRRKDESEDLLMSFVYQLHKKSLLSDRENSLVFFKNCFKATFLAAAKEDALYNPDIDTIYRHADGLASLIVTVATSQGQSNGDVKADKAAFFGAMLGVGVLVLTQHYQKFDDQFNQKTFFRLLSTTICELFDCRRLQPEEFKEFATAFGKCLLILQPQYFPAFSFAWLTAICHRSFLPGILNRQNEAGWKVFVTILQKLLAYMGSLMKQSVILPASKDLYRGTMKLLLILRQDFPDFLVQNCLQVVNHIPTHCVQMRNMVLSAIPSSIRNLPDPFTEGLKVDRLDEIRNPPVILGDFEGALSKTGIKGALDAYFDGGTGDKIYVDEIVHTLSLSVQEQKDHLLEAGMNDNLLMNATVLYVGKESAKSAMASGGQGFSASSPYTKLMESLTARMAPEPRYLLFHAIANQLRYPNRYTHYFSRTILHLFRSEYMEQMASDVQKQVTRVLLERSIVLRPHPWGLNMTLIELLNNRAYRFWDSPFIKSAPGLEQVLGSLLQQMGLSARP